MDLRHLRYFLAIAEEGHFGRAAEKLHIVQPALSMQIRALEEELGGPLFRRTSRRVELTEAGVLFQLEAERTLKQAEHTKASVQKALRGEVGMVRVGFAGNAVFTGKLLNHLRAFRQRYPEVELALSEMTPFAQADAILAGRLDVGYAPGLGAMVNPALLAEQVCQWPWVIAMSAEHPLAQEKHLTAAALVAEPFILYATPGMDDGQLTILRELLGGEPQVSYRAATTLGVLALAAAGMGITLVPATLNIVAVPGIMYKPIVDDQSASDLFLLSRADETAGAVRSFLDVARSDVQPC